MNETLEILINKTKDAITEVYGVCDRMDKVDAGTGRWIPGKKTREILELTLYTYFLFITDADGKITQEEADLINGLLGGQYSLKDFEKLAEKSKVRRPGFAKEVPLIFRAAADLDNRGIIKTNIGKLFYEFFCSFGFLCLIPDGRITQAEYNALMEHLKVVHGYLEENQETESGLEDPQKRLSSFIESLKDPEGRSPLVEIEIEDPAAGPAGAVQEKAGTASDKADADGEEEKTLEELLAELNSLIGLTEVKYDVVSLINLVRIRDIREKMGLKMPRISLHLVFSGNPGTGKTTVARLLAKIYHKIGILSGGQLVEVDRSGLVAGYVGQTALKVQDVLKQAKGGVLFIDEAYALTPENASNDYGLEVIDTLVKGMEDGREDMIVIVAGYTAPMERFIAANPGLKSRFNKFIEFPDYTPEELTEIFRLFCSQNGYRPSVPALDYVRKHFEERIAEKPENFANAREARNLFEFAVARQANRVITEVDPTEEVITLIRAEDVAGRIRNIGRQQFLTENAFAGLVTRRDGIPEQLLSVKTDELELTPRCLRALRKAGIENIKGLLDHFDKENSFSGIEGLSEKNIQEILDDLKELGWEKRPEP